MNSVDDEMLQEKEGKVRGGVEEGCVSPSPTKSRDVSRKTKQEPDLHSAFPPLQGGKLKVEPGEGEVVGPGLGDESHGGLSPTRDMLPPASHHYGLGKEEVLGQLGPHHHLPGMGLEPSGLHPHLVPTDPTAATCNNFSVDSIMTNSRDGSPGERGQLPLPDMSSYGRPPAWSSPSSPSHYPASCLYNPGQTSLEELSNMTAACLNSQSQMGGLYSRQPPWYAMPGHHSPNSSILPNNPTSNEHVATFPQRDYFDTAPKPPSPGPECEGPYRSPGPYRTSYYQQQQQQECEKY